MFRSLQKEERGYSLVEVMVSIMILAIAILPMISMFDTGLNSATASSNYDKARALANLKLEEAKSLSFSNVKNNFPETGTTYDGSGYYESVWMTESGPASADFADFRYRVEKQYMAQPPTGSVDPPDPIDPDGDGEEDFGTSSSATGLIRVTVTVGWGEYNPITDTYSKTYTIFGLVT